MHLVEYMMKCNRYPLFSKLDSLYLTKKKKDTSTFHICVLLDEKYNTLDAFRPVLVWLKEHESCYITIVFMDNNAKREYADNYPRKFSELINDCCDAIIINHNQSSLFYRIINRFKLRHILDYLFAEEKIDTFLIAGDLLGASCKI